MDCKDAVRSVVESARSGREAPGIIRAHLSRCAECAERAELERELSSHLGRMRTSGPARRSSRQSRDELMRQFSARHWRLVHPAWGIGLAASAALLIVLGAISGPLLRTRTPHAPPAIGAWLASSSSSVEPSADFYSAQLAQEEGYTPVPYAPPLAAGERLSVMHAELYPAALTSLGVSIDPAEISMNAAGTVHADVVVGEDGLPRAVRLEQNGHSDGTE